MKTHETVAIVDGESNELDVRINIGVLGERQGFCVVRKIYITPIYYTPYTLGGGELKLKELLSSEHGLCVV